MRTIGEFKTSIKSFRLWLFVILWKDWFCFVDRFIWEALKNELKFSLVGELTDSCVLFLQILRFFGLVFVGRAVGISSKSKSWSLVNTYSISASDIYGISISLTIRLFLIINSFVTSGNSDGLYYFFLIWYYYLSFWIYFCWSTSTSSWCFLRIRVVSLKTQSIF